MIGLAESAGMQDQQLIVLAYIAGTPDQQLIVLACSVGKEDQQVIVLAFSGGKAEQQLIGPSGVWRKPPRVLGPRVAHNKEVERAEEGDRKEADGHEWSPCIAVGHRGRS